MSSRHPHRTPGGTPSRLKLALMELLDREDYDAVTVGEIAERAGVGRSTFYTHFRSKEDLLFDGFGDWLLELAEAHPRGFSLPLLRHVRSRERFFRTVIAGSGSARVRRKVTALLAEVIARQLQRPRDAVAPPDDRSRDGRRDAVRSQDPQARAHALAGAFLALAAWWLQQGRRWSPEDVDRVYRVLLDASPKDGPS